MKDWKYITYLAILGVLLTVLLLTKNKQYDWTVTFSHEDKNPYGAYAFNTLLSTLNNPVKNSYKTLYELKDSLSANQNLLIVSNTFAPGKEDTEALLKYIEAGGTALICANYFYGKFADTLGLEVRDVLFKNLETALNRNDTASLHFVSTVIDSTHEFQYTSGNIHNYIARVDSLSATTLAKNSYFQPVTIKASWGKGTLLKPVGEKERCLLTAPLWCLPTFICLTPVIMSSLRDYSLICQKKKSSGQRIITWGALKFLLHCVTF